MEHSGLQVKSLAAALYIVQRIDVNNCTIGGRTAYPLHPHLFAGTVNQRVDCPYMPSSEQLCPFWHNTTEAPPQWTRCEGRAPDKDARAQCGKQNTAQHSVHKRRDVNKNTHHLFSPPNFLITVYMLRSQSISNLTERKNKALSFLSSLKSRKASSKDLKAQLQPTTQQTTVKPSRPLTLSVSSMNLLHKYDKNHYTSAVARQRGASDKENVPEDHGRTLKTRLSAPNLNNVKSSRLYKRNSTLFTASPLVATLSPHLILSPMSISTSIYSDNETLDSASPYTPTSPQPNDQLDHLPIVIYQLEEEEEPSVDKKRMHRTTNIMNISEFFDSSAILPLSNRELLEMEQAEVEKLKGALDTDDMKVDLRLVENALFITIGGSDDVSVASWADQDYLAAIKTEEYEEEDLYSSL